MFLVVRSLRLLQHLDGVLLKGGVYVVEVEHTELGFNGGHI